MQCIHGTGFCDICNKQYPKYKERYEQLKRQASINMEYYPIEDECHYYDPIEHYDDDDDESSIISPEFYTYDDGESEGFLRHDDDPFDYHPD